MPTPLEPRVRIEYRGRTIFDDWLYALVMRTLGSPAQGIAFVGERKEIKVFLTDRGGIATIGEVIPPPHWNDP